MAFSLFSVKNRIINLVLNDHSIRFVELKQVNPLAVHKYGEHMIPPGIISGGKIIDAESLANILEECIDEWKIHRRSIRFIVPDPLVIIRKVDVPNDVLDDEMKGYLYLELGSSIHLPFEEPVFDIFPLANHDKTKEILLFAAPEKQVMEYAKLFSSLKLNPIAADISPLAIYRLYYRLDKARPDEILFSVQVDLTSINLCIFDNGIPLVMRQLPLTFDMKQWQINKGGSIVTDYTYIGDPEELRIQMEDLENEISKLRDFYRYSLNNENKDMNKFLISGDHPLLPSILKEIKQRFEIPVDVISLENYTKEQTRSVPDSLLLALGLALKEV